MIYIWTGQSWGGVHMVERSWNCIMSLLIWRCCFVDIPIICSKILDWGSIFLLKIFRNKILTLTFSTSERVEWRFCSILMSMLTCARYLSDIFVENGPRTGMGSTPIIIYNARPKQLRVKSIQKTCAIYWYFYVVGI